MKKFLFLTVFLSSAVLLTAGCAGHKTGSDDKNNIEATSQPFTERNVESTDGTYVFDNAGILSSQDFKACNDYAGWLYREKLINPAVVTVNDLKGKAPYDYAAEQYNKLYEGKGSGLLILINKPR